LVPLDLNSTANWYPGKSTGEDRSYLRPPARSTYTKHGGRLDNFRASPLQFRVQGIKIVHPNVNIKADAAPRNVRRGPSSVIGLSKVNYDVIPGDDSEHGRIEE